MNTLLRPSDWFDDYWSLLYYEFILSDWCDILLFIRVGGVEWCVLIARNIQRLFSLGVWPVTFWYKVSDKLCLYGTQRYKLSFINKTAVVITTDYFPHTLARVDWVRERYGFISVGFCQRRTLLTLFVDHVRINTFCLYLLLPPWRDVCCSIHHLFISNRSLLFIVWQYKLEQNLRWHDRRPDIVVLHLPPVERLGSGLYFK